MTISTKYGRTYHYPFSMGTTSDDRINYQDWQDLQKLLAVTKGTGQVVQMTKELAKKYLRTHTPFVWNATNITRSLQNPLIDLFSSYVAKVKIVYLEVPYKQLLEQNRNREYVVPENAIQKMVWKLEIPALWEAHEVEYVV